MLIIARSIRTRAKTNCLINENSHANTNTNAQSNIWWLYFCLYLEKFTEKIVEYNEMGILHINNEDYN